ncbi:MAG TPA: hypothetical protein VJP78_01870, partial [Thermoleophilia bacterium]|nr:hypothetical protein [Thermoleophilia bacterium]
MTTQITQFRLSIFWIEVHLGLLDSDQLAGAPMAFLGRPLPYRKAFNDAQYALRTGTPRSLSSPWDHTKGDRFWEFYLGGLANANVKGDKAWLQSVPFKAVLPLRAECEAPTSLLLSEIFFFPHAVAVLISLTLGGENPASLLEIVDQTIRLRKERICKFVWEGADSDLFKGVPWPGKPEAAISLNGLAKYAMDTARLMAYGRRAEPGMPTAHKPFSVITPIGG